MLNGVIVPFSVVCRFATYSSSGDNKASPLANSSFPPMPLNSILIENSRSKSPVLNTGSPPKGSNGTESVFSKSSYRFTWTTVYMSNTGPSCTRVSRWERTCVLVSTSLNSRLFSMTSTARVPLCWYSLFFRSSNRFESSSIVFCKSALLETTITFSSWLVKEELFSSFD